MKTNEIYERVIFLQGEEADDALERFDSEGPNGLLEYLKEWHYPEEHPESEELWHGTTDDVYHLGRYILTVNTRFRYCGLEYRARMNVTKGGNQ